MQSSTQTSTTSKKMLWAGRIITALVAVFVFFDSIMKLVKAAPVIEGTARIGYPVNAIVPIGTILFVITVVYLIPRTSILGAILLTGHLGGAVASNLRVGDPLFGYILFPVYVGVLAWMGLYLRDDQLRMLIPLRSTV